MTDYNYHGLIVSDIFPIQHKGILYNLIDYIEKYQHNILYIMGLSLSHIELISE